MVGAVGMLAAILRFASLGSPNSLVFDEVFYVRGAYSMMMLGYEGNWTGANNLFAQGDYSGLETEGDFIVHPMVGKLLIQLGMEMFGVNGYGWRFFTALLGTATVVLIALIARHLFRSTLWGGVAGLLVAIDGESIALSRTALLDNFLTFFVVAGFGLVLVDRAKALPRLEAGARRRRVQLGLLAGSPIPGWGPRVGIRWWRILAIVTFGLAASVKWSGLYFAATFLLLSVIYDAVDRRAAGYTRWHLSSLVRAVPTAVASGVIILGVYLATWFQWFTTNGSWDRHWAEGHPGEGVTWLPDALRSFAYYHEQMWHFHTTLTSAHPYRSSPYGWILQLRPTAFSFEDVPGAACGSTRCVTSITALGHPSIWWAGAIALGYALWRVFRRLDVVALTVSVGVLAGWVPWLPFAYRTIFTFYSVAMAPFVILTLVWALSRIAQPEHLGGRWSRGGTIAVASFVAICVVMAGYFAPLWIGWPIPFEYWQIHMWLGSWI